jgi:superfamily II DNA or RNA helicase
MQMISEQPMRLRYHGGTLVLEGASEEAVLPAPFQWIKGKPRCPACHYAELQPWLQGPSVRDGAPRWKRLNLYLADPREPHRFQSEALATWLAADGRGSVVLPTGAGKTFLAVRAIAHIDRSTLIVVPTIDLLHQWYAVLSSAFPQTPIGVWYGGEKDLQEITVTTYHSAAMSIGDFGDRFKLLVFDEAHHLPGPTWHEIALMALAPHRLGLTATYPTPSQPSLRMRGEMEGGMLRTQGEERGVPSLDVLIGPLVYAKTVDDLSGRELADYRTVHIQVDLTAEERVLYDEAYAEYTGYAEENALRESYGAGWWREYTRRSAFNTDARSAKVAERRLRRIVATARAKLHILDGLLKEHAAEQMLIFTEQNELVYEISRRHLIPAITHQSKAKERKEILERFRAGDYRAIVTSRVLNEGVDVPEAKIAVILGGSSNAREYIQRLGRILRKRANKTALLYEVIARDTLEVAVSQRRRRGVVYEVGKRNQ